MSPVAVGDLSAFRSSSKKILHGLPMHEGIYQCQRYKLLLFLFCFSPMPISTSSSGLFKSPELISFPQLSSLYIHGNSLWHRLILPSYGWNGLHVLSVEAGGLQLTFILTAIVMLKMQKLLVLFAVFWRHRFWWFYLSHILVIKVVSI